MNEKIKKRIVYYIGGFDPRGVRHYHSMYKEHFTKQSAINGMSGSVSSRKKVHNHLYQWEIEADDHGHKVHTTYNFLSWDDIVREQWSSGLVSYYKDIVLFIRGYLLSGLFLLFTKESPKQLIAGLYPLIYLMGGVILALYGSLQVYSLLQGWIGSIVGMSLGFGIVIALQRLASKIGVFWLLRIYVFCLHWSKGQIQGMNQRIDTFAHELATTMNHSDDVEEVLLVSHSVGTIVAISVVARALEKSDHWDKFGMVTLGECIPLVSFQPNAHHYREELVKLGKQKNLVWLDYTSPIDGACFPLYDFIPLEENLVIKRSFPRYLSPRFHTLFTTITYKKLRRDWYTTHFLYLMSTQKSGEYDYYALTASANSIRKLF
jgi:hypothetical protein